MSHWIQKAIKHPGALRANLHVGPGHIIPSAKLAKAAHGHGVVAKRARLAQTLRKFH